VSCKLLDTYRKEIDGYLEYRKLRGEHITPDSLVFRKSFSSSKEIDINKPLSVCSISFMINQLLSTLTGIRPSMKGKRTNLMQCHGLRKFPADKRKIQLFVQQQSDNKPDYQKIVSLLDKIEDRQYQNVSDVTKAGIVE
jgi:hypothetical protein